MLEIPAMWAIGGLLSLLVILATALIKTSYSRVELTLTRVEASLAHLTEHATIHAEWKKGVDRRLSVLEKKAFGHARADDTPPSGE